jgi:hypothetical protein
MKKKAEENLSAAVFVAVVELYSGLWALCAKSEGQ